MSSPVNSQLGLHTAKANKLRVYVSVLRDEIMKLTEFEEKCNEIEASKKQREQQLANLKKMELEAKEKSKEAQMLRELAKIRGEEPPAEKRLDALEKTKEDVEALENKIKKLENEAFEGMKDINLPIPQEIPKVDSAGNSIISLEGGPYNCAVKFIASTMSSGVPLELDKTLLHPDKIVVTGVKEPSHVIERMKILRDNLGRLARIALNAQDPDVEEVVEYLHESEYRDLWEVIKGRKKISNEEIYSDLNLSETKDKKRVRNFFTNLEQKLKDKFPFMRIDLGIYQLSFFGSLVWKRYNDRYMAKSASEEAMHEPIINKEEKKEEPRKTSMPSLNKYLSNEDKELIYGKEGK